MNTITVTIPLEAAALTRAADLFAGLADDYRASPTADDLSALDNATADLQAERDRPVETQAATAETSEARPTDTKGVPFDPTYCGESQVPYYGTGKRTGQWKKKRGVSDDDYDNWYASELAKIQNGSDDDTDDAAPINTQGAFGPGPANPPAAATPAPSTAGEFMGWVSEKQAAGLLTQDQIQSAYVTAGLNIQDLFPPNDEGTVAGRIGSLYQILAATAGA